MKVKTLRDELAKHADDLDVWVSHGEDGCMSFAVRKYEEEGPGNPAFLTLDTMDVEEEGSGSEEPPAEHFVFLLYFRGETTPLVYLDLNAVKRDILIMYPQAQIYEHADWITARTSSVKVAVVRKRPIKG